MIRLPWLPANRPLVEPANENAPVGGYAELHCRSYFSFLDGASSPEDLVERAHGLGYSSLAITDVDGVYGLPRAHAHARQVGFPVLVGSEVTVEEDGRVVLLAMDAAGYARLCRVLTNARLRCEKGRARATWDEVLEETAGLIVLTGGSHGPIDRALAAGDAVRAGRMAARLAEAYGDRAYVELTHHLRPGDDERLAALVRLGRAAGLAPVVTQDACYALAADRMTHDVLTCIREKTTLALAGRRLQANGERHLHDVAELRRRFAAVPDAVDRRRTSRRGSATRWRPCATASRRTRSPTGTRRTRTSATSSRSARASATPTIRARGSSSSTSSGSSGASTWRGTSSSSGTS